MRQIYAIILGFCLLITSSFATRIDSADLTTEANDEITFNIVETGGNPNKNIFLIYADDSPENIWYQLPSVPNFPPITITNTPPPNIYSRFYKVVEELNGNYTTNSEEWAMYKQDRTPNTKQLISIPIDYGTNNTLNSTLGEHLERGGFVGNNTFDTNKSKIVILVNDVWEEHYLLKNVGKRQWYDGTAQSTNVIDSTMGIIFYPKTGPTRTRDTCVFVGKSFKYTTDIPITTNSMQLIPWTRSVSGFHDGSSNNMLGFVSSGAVGGIRSQPRRGRTITPLSELGDQIWIWDGTKITEFYWLMDGMWDSNMDGKWWNDRTSSYAYIELQPGKSYWYKRFRGTNFVWKFGDEPPIEAPLMLSIDSIDPLAAYDNPGITIKWLSLSNETYSIYRSTNLMQGFSLLINNLMSMPPINSYLDYSATNNGPYFYKIKKE